MTYEEQLEKNRSGGLEPDEEFSFLEENGIVVDRFRYVVFLRDEKPFTDDDIKTNVCDYLDHLASFAKKPKKFGDVHGRKRKEMKRHAAAFKRRLLAYADMHNAYCGKDVVCVVARQGGANRAYYPMDVGHPRYLGDVDSPFDDTYLAAFYDFREKEENE